VKLEADVFDKNALYVLEALSLNSFENALNAFEEFLGNLDFFCGSTNFLKAAHALDIAALAFKAVDANHDFVLTKENLDAFIVSNPMDKTLDSLRWLSANFQTLERLCFFEGGIALSEIEAARDVFYGLGYLHENADKLEKFAGRAAVSDKTVLDFLRAHGETLDLHHSRGLGELVKYLAKVELSRKRRP
jgi:hypothetical protein